MKKLMVILFVLLLCWNTSNADILKWDEVVAPTNIPPVIGYIVHYQEVGDAVAEVYNVNVGNVTQYQLPGSLNLETGKSYRFWITVYNKDGESGPSNTADWIVPNWLPPVDKLPNIVINVPDSSSVNITIVNE